VRLRLRILRFWYVIAMPNNGAGQTQFAECAGLLEAA